MNLDQRPDLSLQQHLHLTAELKQGIAILQMTALDLSKYVTTCVEENPFLDDDDWMEPRHPLEPDKYSPSISSDDLFEKRGHGSPERFGQEKEDMSQRVFSVDRFLVEDDSLDDYLSEQLRMATDSQRDQVIGEYLIGSIDDSGYLQIPVGEAAHALGVEEDDVLCVLKLIQHFQPSGIGARNLAECLTIQLEDKGELTPQMKDLIDNHLNEFESRALATIAREMGISLAELNELLDIIRPATLVLAGNSGAHRIPYGPRWLWNVQMTETMMSSCRTSTCPI